jgi:lipopolysaccharide export system permease protein
VGPLVFALTALTSLLLLNYIAKQIGNLVGKGLSAGVIGEFFLLSLPFTVAMTMPMSVLVATLYAFSRLASENEIMALKANGVSMSRLLVPVLLSASLVSVSMIAFNDVVLPASNHQLRVLQGNIARKKPTFGLREQIINQVADRQVYLKAMTLTPDNRMVDVTIYDLSDVTQRRTIYADSGELAFAANGNDLVLTLHHGASLVVPRTEPGRLERLTFDRNYVVVENVANQLDVTQTDSYKSDREMSVCELQNDVARYGVEYDKARADLELALRAAVTEALTGIPVSPPEISPTTTLNVSPGSPAPRSPHASLGRAYCDFVGRLKGIGNRTTALVPTLHAAEPPRAGGATPGESPALTGRAASQASASAGSARRAAQDSALSRAAQRAVPAVGRSLPVQLGQAVENSGTRLRDNLRFVNQAGVELHKKFAISIACTVFVLIGAPIALRFPRGGVGLVIGVSLAIFGVYYVGLIAGEALADRNVLTPFWAMWSANILLTMVGLVLLARMGRETATTRGGDFAEMLEIARGYLTGPRRQRAPVRPNTGAGRPAGARDTVDAAEPVDVVRDPAGSAGRSA